MASMALIALVAGMMISGTAEDGCASLPPSAEAASRLSDLFDYDRPAESEATLLKLAELAQSCGNRELAAASMAQAARAQAVQGKLAEARATLDKARPLASSPLTKIKLLLETGRIARRERNIVEARALLNEAFTQAKLHGADALAADAAHLLALIEDGPASAQWTDRGLAVAEGSADPVARRWVGNLAYNAGVRLAESGDHLAAALMFARSVAARRVENDPELVAAAELALSAELALLGKLEEAEAIQQRLLREAARWPDFAAEVREQIAKTEKLRQANAGR